MRSSFIYSLSDPREPDLIRYIGRTNNPTKRLGEHCRIRGSRCHKINWIASLLEQGIRPIMEIVEEYPSECSTELQEAEEFYIAYLKFLGAPLTNTTSKSCGVVNHTGAALDKMKNFQSNRPQEVNRKISESLRGRKMDPEVLERHMARVNSTEWKEKMSSVHKGKHLTEAQKADLSKFHTGKKRPASTGAKISESLKGQKKSADHIAKIAASQRGVKRAPWSPEHRAAQAATRLRKKLQLVIQPV